MEPVQTPAQCIAENINLPREIKWVNISYINSVMAQQCKINLIRCKITISQHSVKNELCSKISWLTLRFAACKLSAKCFKDPKSGD